MKAHASSAHLTEQLSYWAEMLSQRPPRSLSLLRSIEDTLLMFRRWRGLIENFTNIMREEGDKILANAPQAVLDKDGSAQEALLNAQNMMKEHYEDLKTWCDRAKSSSAFDDNDGIVDECSRLTNAIAELHNYINSLRWKIAEHDADHAVEIGTFDSIEELAAHLNA